jgi:hypothetical protein
VKGVVDNDVLLKGSCYGLLGQYADAIPGVGPIGFLGAARFVLGKRIHRLSLRGNPTVVQQRLLDFLAAHQQLEPTTSEQSLAAKLESAAQKMLLNLDSGESQLISVLLLRTIPFLVTGDKRAIIAIEQLLTCDSRLGGITGKIVCLERLLQTTMANVDEGMVRTLICAEPDVDKTLTICFGCSSGSDVAVDEGLNSYISDLRRNAPTVLAI